jgi:hypothetical protein
MLTIIAEINKCAAIAEGFLTTAEAGVQPGYLASTGKTNNYYDKWGYDPNGAVAFIGSFSKANQSS